MGKIRLITKIRPYPLFVHFLFFHVILKPGIVLVLTKHMFLHLQITPLKVFDIFMPKHSIILEISSNGDIVTSLHDHGAKVISASGEGFEFNNTLYIGSFWTPYIGMLNLTLVRSLQ